RDVVMRVGTAPMLQIVTLLSDHRAATSVPGPKQAGSLVPHDAEHEVRRDLRSLFAIDVDRVVQVPVEQVVRQRPMHLEPIPEKEQMPLAVVKERMGITGDERSRANMEARFERRVV